MASLNTSEIQFAFIFFAKFNELHDYQFHHVIAPNQRQEGNILNDYRGTDLVLDEYFLQFKMSEYMIGNNAAEFRDNLIGVPYFKFDVYNRPLHPHNQGQLDFLKWHSNDHNKEVYYVVPCFDGNYNHRQNQPNFWSYSFYQSDAHNIWDFSCFLNIADIPLNVIDNVNNHKIIYQAIGNAYYLSEPQKIGLLRPTIESKEKLRNRVIGKEKKLDDILKSRVNEIKDFMGSRFFEKHASIFQNINISKLQNIYLNFFNIIWIPYINRENNLLSNI